MFKRPACNQAVTFVLVSSTSWNFHPFQEVSHSENKNIGLARGQVNMVASLYPPRDDEVLIMCVTVLVLLIRENNNNNKNTFNCKRARARLQWLLRMYVNMK